MLIELAPDSGTVRHATVVSAGLTDFEPGVQLMPAHGGVWFLAGHESEANNNGTDEVDSLFFVEVGAPAAVSRIDLDGIERYAPLVADGNYVYILPTEGPMVVVDADTRAEVARIDHELFIDNAYALTLTDEAVWVAVQADAVLEFRS